MQVILRRYGNSTVAVLPPAVLKDLGLTAGQAMKLGTTDRGEIVLADLIARCDPKAPPPADLALWSLPLRKAVISHATPALLSA